MLQVTVYYGLKWPKYPLLSTEFDPQFCRGKIDNSVLTRCVTSSENAL